MSKSRKTRIKQNAEELYQICYELQRVCFMNGGEPDDIMAVAEKALRIIRKIDLDLDLSHTPPIFKTP